MQEHHATGPQDRPPVLSAFSGGCACGAIRYECSAAPLLMLNCHCRACQRSSGGGWSSVVIVAADAFALSKGEPRYHAARGDAGHTARRGFCAECGSPLFGRTSRTSEFVAIKAASLDDPRWFTPVLDIWTSSAQPWASMDPRTHKFAKDIPPRPEGSAGNASDDPANRSPEEIALALFEQGFTCGQAVLAAFAERHGLGRDVALRAACAFGGGVARTGGTCGAVSGAWMAIGLQHGRTKVEDEAMREKTYDAARAFLARFRQEHGSHVCRELLGIDISTPEGHEAARKAGLFTSRCPAFVRSAARIVATLV